MRKIWRRVLVSHGHAVQQNMVVPCQSYPLEMSEGLVVDSNSIGNGNGALVVDCVLIQSEQVSTRCEVS